MLVNRSNFASETAGSWPWGAEVTRRGRFWLRALPVAALALAVAPLPAPELAAGDVHYRSPFAAAFESLPCSDGRLRGFDPCGPAEEATPSAEASQAAAAIERRQHANATPANDALLATVRLVDNKVFEAVTLLEIAVADTPDSQAADKAAFLNDLAVAYLARATAANSPHDLARALDAASQAGELSPDLPEPCFNRAVALTRLSLTEQAAAAWKSCAAGEHDADWRREIERRESALAAPPTAAAAAEAQGPGGVAPASEDDPKAKREQAVEGMLPAWGAAFIAGRARDAATIADAGARKGRELLVANGDPTVAEVFAPITGGGSVAGPPARLAALAAGAKLYAQARQDLNKYRIAESLQEFEQARDRFIRAASPLAGWAELGSISCEFYHDHFDQSLARLGALQSTLDEARYPVLAAYVHWVRGMVHARLGDLRSAQGDFEQTTKLFDRSHERENQGAGYQLVGEMDHLLGDEDKAWRERQQSMYLLRDTPLSRRRLMLLREAGESLLAESRGHAAMVFLDEAVRIAGTPRDRAEALMWRVRAANQIGRAESARIDLQDGFLAAAETDDVNLRDRVVAELNVAEADLKSRTAPQAALALLDQAQETYKQNGHVLPRAAVYLLRARIEGQLRQVDRQLADLAAGVELFESQWRSLDDEQKRVTFLGTALDLYDQAIGVNAQLGDDAAALDLAERSRAFWSGAPGAVDPSWLRALAAAPSAAGGGCSAAAPPGLPAGVTIVEYAVERDGLLIWLLTCRGLRLQTFAADEGRVNAVASRLRDAARFGSAATEFTAAAEAAYGVLVQPIAGDLPAGEQLVFVPDKVLYGVPFAALRDPGSRQYLMQGHDVSIAPSATFFVSAARPAAARRATDDQDALLVSPQPVDLKATTGEIDDLRNLYPHAVVLTGEDAGHDQVLQELDSHPVLHYAGHAEVNPTNPFASKLPLGGGASDAIRMGDLAGPAFAHLDLIVLSACSTVVAAPTRTGGFLGLARPFLSRGARAVVGTLWDVDDAASRSVVVAFHRALRRPGTSTPAAALRAAQQQCLEMGRPPSAWAAFAVVGAGTN